MTATPPFSQTPPFGSTPTRTRIPEPTKDLPAPRLTVESGSWLNLQDDAPVGDGKGPDIPLTPGDYPTILGYTISNELGRGGMGVVYRAVQESLHRPVALKMILRGFYATPEERLRFLIEAEMLARAKHPNIVQVHEVGTHDGFPFLSLELVEGGTLQEFTNGAPQPAQQSAALLAILADATQAAHSQGIIHRDLKPSNILLHRPEQEANGHASHSLPTHLRSKHPLYGIPKITDFGLAKRFDDDSHLTTTGHVLGTPSYMAPEQAQGKREIGPAADLYALGAILYELLTGTPPFRAASAIETLNQVIHDDPPPLDRPGVAVPRDLAVICLKCLEKDPARRYRSAAALGEDLARFLRDEPIAARPISRRERALRWCRRHPDKAALALALVLALALGFAGVVWKWQEAVDQRQEARAAELDAKQKTAAYRKVVEETLFAVAEESMKVHLEEAVDRGPTAWTEEAKTLTRLRLDLLERALRHFRTLPHGNQADAVTQWTLARATRQLAHTLTTTEAHRTAAAGAGPPQLGRIEALLAESKQLLAGLVAESPERADYRHELAMTHRDWANAHRLQRSPQSFTRAEQLLSEAIAAETQALRLAPGSPDFQREMALHHYFRYEALGELKRGSDEQLAELRRFVAIREVLAGREPNNLARQLELGGAYRKLQHFHYLAGDCAAALAAGEQAQAVLADVLAAGLHPGLARYYLFEVFEIRAKCQEHLGETATALDCFRRAADFVPPQALPRLLVQHAYCAAQAGRLEEADQIAAKLLARQPRTDDIRYNAFCIYASCCQQAEGAAAERFAELAEELLAELDQAGSLSNSSYAAAAAAELEASGLRQHPRFLAWRRKLDKKISK